MSLNYFTLHKVLYVNLQFGLENTSGIYILQTHMHPMKELNSTCTHTSHTFNLNFKSNANLLPNGDGDNPQAGFSPLTRENSRLSFLVA